MTKLYSSSLNFLDLIPDKLYQRLVTHQYRSSNHTQHSFQQRALGILEIRQQLLKGEQVSQQSLLSWLDADLADEFVQQLNVKSVLQRTIDNESFTDDVLLHALNWLDKIDDEIAFTDDNILADPDVQQKSMQELNKRFALERSLGWDLKNGIHSQSELNLLIEAHATIKNSKRLQSVIRMVGRLSHDSLNINNRVGLNQTDIIDNKNDNNLPDENAINSVTGVYYGDDIGKMLPSELALLGNSKLKMLWHARRAERQLLNYHYKGLMSEHSPSIQPQSINHEISGKKKVKTRGAIILCVDTSASMQGYPEKMAKALALEVMRVALLEKRLCYLYCFSGADEIFEIELNLQQGWESILKYLLISFNGGTDINNVLTHALTKQNEKHWKQADILLISDGLFKISEAIVENVLLDKTGLRVIGFQLGNWRDNAFYEICHQVYNLNNVQ